MLEEQENCLDCVLTASFRHIPGWANGTSEAEGGGEKGNEYFVGQDGGTGRKRSLDRLAFGRRNFETGTGKPTEVAGLLPPSVDKRTGGKTNRIRKEFLPPGKI